MERVKSKRTLEANDEPIRIGVSSCLLGTRVRFDHDGQIDRADWNAKRLLDFIASSSVGIDEFERSAGERSADKLNPLGVLAADLKVEPREWLIEGNSATEIDPYRWRPWQGQVIAHCRIRGAREHWHRLAGWLIMRGGGGVNLERRGRLFFRDCPQPIFERPGFGALEKAP
jgi:hypothetical protein